MRQTFSVMRKELDTYFSSAMALIFVGVFLAVTLFTFFWVDAFWARGTADVRPLFRSMPVLLIFLVATLTMRQWSEEKQAGTLEILLTLPIKLPQLVLGKFLAVMALIALALALTLFLPVTVALLGNLDWGPVIGGYMASLLLASAYVAIGLFVSSRTDNQIVALISTVIVCGAFHLIGTSAITDLFTTSIAEFLRSLSTSARFASIERGVVDLRDLLYYISLTLVFLTLNVLSLDAQRWGRGSRMAGHRRNSIMTSALLAANLLVLNALVFPVNAVRLDLTEAGEYSLSGVTRDLLTDLQEPLFVRAYFSEENHPLLDPLVPTVRDTLEEYRLAADGNMTLEVVDPIDDPELEAEANQTYGIRPSPLQVVDRAGTSLINVYFDILIQYGDQTEVLNFRDLIELDQFGDNEVEVRLRNLEYDLTSAISRTVRGFQSLDAILASLESPANATLYVTPATLPEPLIDVPETIQTIASEIEGQAGGMFTFSVVDVTNPQSGITPQQLFDRYQIQPIATSIFSPDTYYMHVVIEAGDEVQVLYPSGELSEAEIRTALESALKRASSGFLQVVGIWTPPQPGASPFGPAPPSLAQYQIIQQLLREDYEVRNVDLTSGQAPGDIDVLLVIAPQNMSALERYAVDQFLMRGGSVFVAGGNYALTQSPADGSLALQPITNGMRDLLGVYGVNVSEALVLDPQNEPFPIQVPNQAGQLVVQAINYPHFIDVRQDGMNDDTTLLNNLPAITLNWTSPLTVNAGEGVEVIPLLESSDESWITTDLNVIPNVDLYPDNGFPVTGPRDSRVLAVALRGSFSSYYAENPAPFASPAPLPEATPEATAAPEATLDPSLTATPNPTPDPVASVGTIERSPSSSRLIVVGSAEFLNDNVLNLSASFSGDRYLNSLQFVLNSIAWFTEDAQLAAISARSTTVRLLDPISESEQSTWEFLNYGVALLALGGLGAVWRIRKRTEQPMDLGFNTPSDDSLTQDDDNQADDIFGDSEGGSNDANSTNDEEDNR